MGAGEELRVGAHRLPGGGENCHPRWRDRLQHQHWSGERVRAGGMSSGVRERRERKRERERKRKR